MPGKEPELISSELAPGASLGGARPKASVLDKHGHLWIAKFPSINDTYDVAAWEMVVNELAIHAGIDMSKGMLQKFKSSRHTYLSKRFDRTPTAQRIHFASAMTLLGQNDGDSGASYLDLAQFIIQYGATPSQDLEQLWRRIVFYIAVKNTDDHLRNHGFLLRQQGWQLSPAYDVNPVYFGAGLSLNISQTDNSPSLELASEVAQYFRIDPKTADQIIKTTKRVVNGWGRLADKYKISTKEKDLLAGAFENQ